MTLKEKRIFFNWLQKHKALQHYKKSRHLFLIDPSRRLDIISYLDLGITNAICSAFTWVYTEQGETYWRNLDILWRSSEEYDSCFPI